MEGPRRYEGRTLSDGSRSRSAAHGLCDTRDMTIMGPARPISGSSARRALLDSWTASCA